MAPKSLPLFYLIAILGTVACQAQTSTPESPPADPATETTTATPTAAAPMNLPEGISLSEDGQTLVMAAGSTLEAYCRDGQGKLAISYVGEGGISGQAVGCEQTFELFDAARGNGFADSNFVAPVVKDNALQLQDAEYIKLDCQADHAGLEPVLPERSDGDMRLECI